ncbi:AsmA family protein [Polynucleobacter necessarius]|uniref:AsmA family protein n=1 Tax=Polynucleobacter necessarius TaxID=576610 RepID=UPI0013B05D51|nr:AsmA family protein [Polynucleobacter necessarius]
MEVNLQANQAGVGNWNFTPPTMATSTSGTSPTVSDTSSSVFASLSEFDIADARIHYQDGGQAEKLFKLPKLSFSGHAGKSEIFMDLQYAQHSLNLQGKTSSLLDAYFGWDQTPVKMDLDLILTLNGKSLAIAGKIDKNPQVLPHLNINLRSKAFDLAPLAGSAAIAGSAGKSHSAPVRQAQGKYFFSDEPLPFDFLPLADGSININIAELAVPGQTPFSNFKTTLQFKKNSIDANDFSFNIGKGSAHAQIAIIAFDSPTPKISFKGLASGFTLEQMIVTTDANAKVAGGSAHMAWNLRGSGVSPHQLLSHATGAIQVSVGLSTLDAKFLNKGGDFIITVFDVINPLYKKSNQTVLECAVPYLPINNGIVNIQNSVGVETDRLGITLSGSVKLASETLNIKINPREKSGLTTGLDLAGLVNIGGTLQNPQTGVNKAGVVNSAVSIGLGFLTGGISIAAENAKSLATKSQPCKAALRPWSDIYSASK